MVFFFPYRKQLITTCPNRQEFAAWRLAPDELLVKPKSKLIVLSVWLCQCSLNSVGMAARAIRKTITPQGLVPIFETITIHSSSTPLSFHIFDKTRNVSSLNITVENCSDYPLLVPMSGPKSSQKTMANKKTPDQNQTVVIVRNFLPR